MGPAYRMSIFKISIQPLLTGIQANTSFLSTVQWRYSRVLGCQRGILLLNPLCRHSNCNECQADLYHHYCTPSAHSRCNRSTYLCALCRAILGFVVIVVAFLLLLYTITATIIEVFEWQNPYTSGENKTTICFSQLLTWIRLIVISIFVGQLLSIGACVSLRFPSASRKDD